MNKFEWMLERDSISTTWSGAIFQAGSASTKHIKSESKHTAIFIHFLAISTILSMPFYRKDATVDFGVTG
jgi:hypothetical protein